MSGVVLDMAHREGRGAGPIYIVLVLIAVVVIVVLALAAQASIDRERGRGRFGVAEELLLRERYPGGWIVESGGDQAYVRCESGGWEMRYYPDHRRLPFYDRLCW